jgi:hypothetical protein
MAKKKWIQGAIKKPSSFTKQAKSRGLTPAQFQSQVLSNPDRYSSTTVRRANLRKTLVKMPGGGMAYMDLPEYGMGGDIVAGAASGASLGTLFGPVGTGIGAVIGGATGIIGSEKKRKLKEGIERRQEHALDVQKAFAAYDPTSNVSGTSMLSMAEGGMARPKFESMEEAFAYYKSLGAGNPIIYAPEENAVYKQESDTSKISKHKTTKKDVEDTIQYMRSRNIPKKEKGGRITQQQTPNLSTDLGPIDQDLAKKIEGYKSIIKSTTSPEAKDLANRRLIELYDTRQMQLFNQINPQLQMPQMAYGGDIQQQVPVEMEGGESFVTPNGEDFNIEGPRHGEGGVPLEVPVGTDVYSDRLRNGKTGNTFSTDNKKLTNSMAKYEKILSDPNATAIAKRSAEKMLGKLEARQNDLFVSQERMKMEKPSAAESKQKFFNGGGVTAPDRASVNPFWNEIMYPYGNIDSALGLNLQRPGSITSEDAIGIASTIGTGIQPRLTPGQIAARMSGSGVAPVQSRYSKILSDVDPIQARGLDESYIPTTNIIGGEVPGQITSPINTAALQSDFMADIEVPETLDLGESSTMDLAGGDAALSAGKGIGSKIAGGIGAVAQMAPALYNIGQGLFGEVEYEDPAKYANIAGQAAAQRMRSQRYNIDPQLRDIRRTSAIARRNLAGAAGGSRGLYMAGAISSTAARNRATADLYAQKQNVENQYRMQGEQMAARVGAQDAVTRMRVADINAQREAAQAGMLTTGLSQLSGVMQAQTKLGQQQAMDQQRLALYKDMFKFR